MRVVDESAEIVAATFSEVKPKISLITTVKTNVSSDLSVKEAAGSILELAAVNPFVAYIPWSRLSMTDGRGGTTPGFILTVNTSP
jgi:hypothetical protein